MEESEKKKKDYRVLKRGAVVVLILAFVLFNASKLFSYIGSKHTIETGPPPEGTVLTKSASDSLVKKVQNKLDASKQQNDSLRAIITGKDTELLRKSDSIAKSLKRKVAKTSFPYRPPVAQAKKPQ